MHVEKTGKDIPLALVSIRLADIEILHDRNYPIATVTTKKTISPASVNMQEIWHERPHERKRLIYMSVTAMMEALFFLIHLYKTKHSVLHVTKKKKSSHPVNIKLVKREWNHAMFLLIQAAIADQRNVLVPMNVQGRTQDHLLEGNVQIPAAIVEQGILSSQGYSPSWEQFQMETKVPCARELVTSQWHQLIAAVDDLAPHPD